MQKNKTPESKAPVRNQTTFERLKTLLMPPQTDSIAKLIPITGLSGDMFQLRDGTFLDIVSIVTKDLTGASADDFDFFVAMWAKLYRTYGTDLKLVSLNAPTDTRAQRHYIEHKFKKNKNPLYAEILEEKLQQLKNVERHRTDREYYIFVFSKTEEDYRENMAIIRQNLVSNFLAEEIPMSEKLSVLEKLCNQNATLQIRNSEKVEIMYPNTKKRSEVAQIIQKRGYDPFLIHAIQPRGGVTAENERILYTGQGYLSCITISVFPSRVNSCWMSRLMNLDNTICCLDIHTENVEDSKRNINSGMREQERRAYDNVDATVVKTAQNRYSELEALWDDIDLMGEILKLLRVRIFVSADTYIDCDTKLKEVNKYLEGNGYTAGVFLNEGLNDWKSMFLSYTQQDEDEDMKDYKRYGQPMESITVADGIPFHFTNLSDPCGTYWGTTNSSDGSVLYDIHTKTGKRTAYNAVVVGTMGSGKSSMLKKLFWDLAVRGHYVRGFDPSGEYRKMVQHLGGTYIALDGTAGILNALEILRTSDEGENMCFVNHLSKLRTVYLMLSRNATPEDANSFQEYLQEFYMVYGLLDPDKPIDAQQLTGLPATRYPIFSEFVKFLYEKKNAFHTTGDQIADGIIETEAKRCDKIYRTFKYVVSAYGKLFDGHTTIDNVMDEQLVFFNIANLSKADDEVFDVQIFLALTLCWDNCVQVGSYMKKLYEENQIAWEDITRFEIIVDEAHKFINTQKIPAVEQLTVFAREARKYFGGIIPASQSLRDFVPEGSSDLAINKLKTLFELCESKFIFRQDSNALPMIKQVFGGKLTETDLASIPKLNVGEAIFCTPDRTIQFNIELTQLEKDNLSGGA